LNSPISDDDSFVGQVTKSQPLMIVYEFCSNGNLRDFLRRNRPAPNTPPGIGMDTMLSFINQIASGMAYLECKNVVHGDLCAFGYCV
jgi:serine/threonine protein kinase